MQLRPIFQVVGGAIDSRTIRVGIGASMYGKEGVELFLIVRSKRCAVALLKICQCLRAAVGGYRGKPEVKPVGRVLRADSLLQISLSFGLRSDRVYPSVVDCSDDRTSGLADRQTSGQGACRLDSREDDCSKGLDVVRRFIPITPIAADIAAGPDRLRSATRTGQSEVCRPRGTVPITPHAGV